MKKVIIIIMLVLLSTFAFAQQPQLKREQSKVIGLEKAVLQVRNQEQKQHLEQVMEKISSSWMMRLESMKQVTFMENENGNVEVRAVKNARFLNMFWLGKVNRYSVNEEGEMIYRKGWLDFLWSNYN